MVVIFRWGLKGMQLHQTCVNEQIAVGQLRVHVPTLLRPSKPAIASLCGQAKGRISPVRRKQISESHPEIFPNKQAGPAARPSGRRKRQVNFLLSMNDSQPPRRG
jgi:hypothetical protein